MTRAELAEQVAQELANRDWNASGFVRASHREAAHAVLGRILFGAEDRLLEAKGWDGVVVDDDMRSMLMDDLNAVLGEP